MSYHKIVVVKRDKISGGSARFELFTDKPLNTEDMKEIEKLTVTEFEKLVKEKGWRSHPKID